MIRLGTTNVDSGCALSKGQKPPTSGNFEAACPVVVEAVIDIDFGDPSR